MGAQRGNGGSIAPEFGEDRVSIRPEYRRRAVHAVRIVGTFDRKSQYIERPILRVIDGDAHLLVPALRIVEHFVKTQNAPAELSFSIQCATVPVRVRALISALIAARCSKRPPLV